MSLIFQSPKVIENFLVEYKQSFHNALLWVQLREKIIKFLKKESSKNAPGEICSLYLRSQIFLLSYMIEVDRVRSYSCFVLRSSAQRHLFYTLRTELNNFTDNSFQKIIIIFNNNLFKIVHEL